MVMFSELTGVQRNLALHVFVGSINFANVGAHPDRPIMLTGTSYHMMALVELLYQRYRDNLALVISLGDKPQDEPFSLNSELSQTLRKNNGYTEVGHGGPCMLATISYDRQHQRFQAELGYSVRGLMMMGNADGNVDTYLNVNPDAIVYQTLFELYQLTGHPKYSRMAGERVRANVLGGVKYSSPAADPRGLYTILGLNPIICRIHDQETVTKMILAAKQVLFQSYSAAAKAESLPESLFLVAVDEAAKVLGDPQQRNQYNNDWL